MFAGPFGEYSLQARRKGDGLLLRVSGELGEASAASLRRALVAICCQEESRGIDVTLDMADLSIGDAPAMEEMLGIVRELAASLRNVTLIAASCVLAQRLKESGLIGAQVMSNGWAEPGKDPLFAARVKLIEAQRNEAG